MVISLDKYLKNKIYLIPEGRKTNQDYLPTIEELRGKIVIQGTGNIKNLYKDIIFVDSEEKNVLHMLIDHT